MKVGGIVLCGGDSRRMGTSKPWLHCGGEFLLQRMVRIVAEVVQPVIVAARPGQSLPDLPPDCAIVRDELQSAGPLAGLAASFRALADECDAAFVTSCDHPLLKPGFIEHLIDMLGDHPAVMPRHDGHIHSLVAVYRLSTLPCLDELLHSGERRVGRFIEGCSAHVVDAATMASVDPELLSLRNANDAETFKQLLRLIND